MLEDAPPRPAGPRRVLPVALLLVLLTLGLALLFARPGPTPALTLQSVQLLDPAQTLPAFSLESAQGRRIDAEALRGRWTLVFLGFTHCPDICPMTLQELARTERHWLELPEAQRPRLLFISADPERDTPELLARYAAYFSPNILTASSRDLAALTRLSEALKLRFAKVGNGPDYSIDHSGAIALLDPQVRLAGLIRPPLVPEKIAADLYQLTRGAP